MSNNIINTILDAVDIVAKAEVKDAKYDRTIIAQVISCEDETTGKYKCNYQGALMSAYASHPSMKFENGDMVYVLIVAEDTTGNGKIIIGKRY